MRQIDSARLERALRLSEKAASECGMEPCDTLGEAWLRCEKPRTESEMIQAIVKVFSTENSDFPEILENNETLDSLIEKFLMKRAVSRILLTLTPREHRFLSLSFGLEGFHDEKTDREIAEGYGVKSNRMREIKGKTYRKFRHPSRSRHVRNFLY